MGELLMGSQVPSARIAPPYEDTDGDDAVRLLAIGGLDVDEWQALALRDWMATDGGKWVSTTCGLSVPRQNGKTAIVQGRIASGMILYCEQVIYTAHLQKTATETFEELSALFECGKLRKYVKEIRRAIGREQISLKSGARVKFLARTRNGGRGQHGDALIFDEAQELTPEQQASFLPAISASLNPQTILLGTPPDPLEDGGVFRGLRTKARAGETARASWMEFGVEEIGDVTDESRWAAANPALGRRILISTIQGECEQMDPDTFARERLGWWSPAVTTKDEYVLDAAKWDTCASDLPKPTGKTAYGVKFTPDGSLVALAGAVVPKDGPARVSLIDIRTTILGLDWLAEWLNARYDRASCVVIDGRNGVDVLVSKIKDRWRAKGAVIRPKASDMIAAVGGLTNAVAEQSVTWYRPQKELRESAVSSVKRPIGGGFGFGGDNSAPIEAAALALWGCRTSRRDPSRKMLIG